MVNKKDTAYKAAKVIMLFYILFAVISYYWVLSTGTYNGDYLGLKPEISQAQLFINLFITIFPFFVLFYIYIHYKKINRKYQITVPIRAFGIFIVFLVIFNLCITIFFGVGRMGREVYSAPTVIKPFIQILTRFSPDIGVYIYVLNTKKSKLHYLLYLMLIILSLVKFSLGIFVSIGLFFILRYYDDVIMFLKKKFILIIIFLIFFPTVVVSLYSYRNGLRAGDKPAFKLTLENGEIDVKRIIIGRLVGRLSSYSNSAWIIENKNKVAKFAFEMPIYLYPKESLNAFFTTVDRKHISYTNIMLVSRGESYKTNNSFMIGTQGAMLIGLYQNLLVFIINLATILLIVFLTFTIGSYMRCNRLKELLFMGFCGCIISGGNYEYMNNLLYTMMYIGLFLIINFFIATVKPRRVQHG